MAYALPVAASEPAELDYGTAQIPAIQVVRVNKTSPQTVQLLGQALATDNELSRLEHLHDLGRCGLGESVEYLRPKLTDADPQVRAAAAEAAGAIEPRDASSLIAPLGSLLKDPQPIVRREAVRALGQLADSDFIAGSLADPDASVRLAAIAAADRVGMPQPIVASLAKLTDVQRVLALRVLEHHLQDKATLSVTGDLTGPVAERVAAIQYFAQAHATDHADEITKLVTDPNPIVRRNAISAMGRLLSTAQCRPIALKALEDPDLSVQAAAIRLLAEDANGDDLPRLIRLLSSSCPPLQDAAIDALVSIGKSAEAVAPLLTDPNPRLRRDASIVLGRLHSTTGLDVHIRLLSDKDPAVVAQAAESLGLIGAGASAAAPELAKLAEQHMADDAIAPRAIIACGRLGSRAIVPLATSILKNPMEYSWEVRAAAAFAFGRAGNSSEDAVTAHLLLGIYGDDQEAPPVKLEAIKALGQLRFREAQAAVAQIAQTESDPQMRWIAHWASDRISGQSTPFIAPMVEFTADTSLTAASAEDQTVGLAGILSLGAYYLPGAWSPLRLTLINHSAHAVEGYVELPSKRESANFTVRLPLNVPAHSHLVADGLGMFGDQPPQSKGSDQTLATAEWFDRSGKRIARASIMGSPISSARDLAQLSGGSGDSLMIYSGSTSAGNKAWDESLDDPSPLAHVFSVPGAAVESVAVPSSSLPRHVAGYDATRCVAINDIDPDELDIAQRQALFEFIRRGGNLLLFTASPTESDRLLESWLGPYLPLLCVDQRQAERLTCQQIDAPLDLRGWIGIGEGAVTKEATTLLSDSNCVYAAYRVVGAGRVTELTFPPNSLSNPNEQERELMRRFLTSTRIAGRPVDTAKSDPQILASMEQMLGTPTAPWSLAAALTALYVGLVVVVHVKFSGSRGSMAFAIVSAVAVVFSLSMAGYIRVRTVPDQIQGAGVTILRPDGDQAQVRALFAFRGSGQNLSATAESPQTVFAPYFIHDRGQESITVFPFSITQESLKPATVDAVWSGQAYEDHVADVRASAQFGAHGLELKVSNALANPLSDPALVWGESVSLPRLMPGRQTLTPGLQNMPELPSAQSRLRSDLASSVFASGADDGDDNRPELIGSIDTDAAPRTFRTDVSVVWKDQTMLCVPVRVLPSSPGSQVRIDSPYTHLLTQTSEGLPYDPVKRQWIPSSLTGQWLIGIAIPREIGKIEPAHVVIDLDIAAPSHWVRLRAGQVQNRSPRANASGPLVAEWRSPIRPQHVEFDVRPGDFDSDSTVWVLMQVMLPESPGASPGGGSLLPTWQVHRLSTTVEGKVVNVKSNKE